MASGLSGIFLGLTVVTSVVVAGLVVVPVSIGVGAMLRRSDSRPMPHSLVAPSFTPVALVDASKALAAIVPGSATPAA